MRWIGIISVLWISIRQHYKLDVLEQAQCAWGRCTVMAVVSIMDIQ